MKTSNRQSTAKTARTSHSIIEEEEQKRIQRDMKATMEKTKSEHLHKIRMKQRQIIRQEYELQREQLIAKNELYKRERASQWKKRMAKSPFRVDLVADTEKVQVRHQVRKILQEEKRRSELKQKADPIDQP